MGDLGARLKHARVDRGASIHDIAAATKISAITLEALERNDFGRLPGGIFGRAFVRAYALAVGVEPEGAVNEFLAEFTRYEREKAQAVRQVPIPLDDRDYVARQVQARRIARAAIIAAAVVALLIVIWAAATRIR